MPVIGDRNSLNNLYQKQLREFLDEDVNIYKNVFQREKEQVATMQEQIQPKNIDTVREIDINASKLMDGFIRFLSKINAELDIFNTSKEKKTASIKEEILSIAEPITYYNNLMRQITNPALDSVSQSIFENQLTTLIPLLNNVLYNYKRIINDIFEDKGTKGAGSEKAKNQLLLQFISVYSVYKLIHNNINYRIYSIIDYNDITNLFQKTIIQDYPTLTTINIFDKDLSSNVDATNKLKIDMMNAERQELGMPKLTTNQEDEIKRLTGKNIVPSFLSKDMQMLENYRKLKEKVIREPRERKSIEQEFMEELQEQKELMEEEENEKRQEFIDKKTAELMEFVEKKLEENENYQDAIAYLTDNARDYQIAKSKGKKATKDEKDLVKEWETQQKLKREIEEESHQYLKKEKKNIIEKAKTLYKKGNGKKKYIRRKKNNEAIVFDDGRNESYAY